MSSRRSKSGRSGGTKRLKKFTYDQIERKTAARSQDVPEYYQLLMASAVKKDDSGVTFDSTHWAWKKLVRLVTAANKAAKDGPSSTGDNSSTSTSSSSNNNNSSTNNTTTNNNTPDKKSGGTPRTTPRTSGSTLTSPSTPASASGSSARTSPAEGAATGGGGGGGGGGGTTPKRGRASPRTPGSGRRAKRGVGKSGKSSQRPRPRHLRVGGGGGGKGGKGAGRRKAVERTAAPAAQAGAAINPGDADLLAQLKLELQSDMPDAFVIRHACKVCGIPDDLRGRIWKALLAQAAGAKDEAEEYAGKDGMSPRQPTTASGGSAPNSGRYVRKKKKTDHARENVALDLPNQRVIRGDVERTLPHLPTFRTDQVQADLEVLLTLYCKEHNVSYKQGMNYLLAPFFLVDLSGKGSGSDGSAGGAASGSSAGKVHKANANNSFDDIYDCYCQFVGLFAPNTFTDDEFGGLQCVFYLFRLLILYHDPQLCNFLDQYDMGPELYASSWFITLFANRLSTDVLLYLWDVLLLEADEDPLLLYFVALALLLSYREKILNENTVMLPQTLSSIRINSRQEVLGLVHKAKLLYRSQTPTSVREQLRSLTSRVIHVDSAELQELSDAPCLSVSPEEIVQRCYAGQLAQNPLVGGSVVAGATSSLAFTVLDCRPIKQYKAGHLPLALHFDPSLLTKPRKLAREVEALMALKGRHFCFFTEGLDASKQSGDSGAMLNLYFVRKGFKYVSLCRGGYAAVHALIQSPSNDFELVDHSARDCYECNPRNRTKGRSFFTAFRQRVSTFLAEAPGSVANGAVPGMAAPAQAGSSAALGAGDADAVVGDAFKDYNLPEALLQLPSTVETNLLTTVLFDRRTRVPQLDVCIKRLASLAVGTALDGLDTTPREVHAHGGGAYPGVETDLALCGVTLTEADESVLSYVLEPYTDIGHVEVGRIRFGHVHATAKADTAEHGDSSSASHGEGQPQPTGLSAVVQLPDDVASRAVFLFRVVLDMDTEADLANAIAELVRRGCIHIIVVVLIGVRPAIWRLSERFEQCMIVVTAVCELKKIPRKEGGSITAVVPDIGPVEERMDKFVRDRKRRERHKAIARPVFVSNERIKQKRRTLG